MEGSVRTWYKTIGIKNNVILKSGDISYAETEDEHKAEHIGVAKILVIEKSGSI